MNIERLAIVESRGFDALKWDFICEDWYNIGIKMCDGSSSSCTAGELCNSIV